MTKICKECRGEIPREATTCRHCGRTGIPIPPRNRLPLYVGVALAIVIGAGVFGGDGTPTPTRSNEPVASAEVASRPAFTDMLTRIGETAVNMGLATDYRISWGGDLELTVSSLLPGDARAVANAICGNPYGIEPRHQLKVFILTSSDRPAAVCDL
jgi:hypothetical protein